METATDPLPTLRTLWRSLPGRVTSAVALTPTVMWLILDPEKVDATERVGVGQVILFLIAGSAQ